MDKALSRGHMPVQSVANNLKLPSVPFELSCLNKLEIRLVSLRVAFMKMVALPSGKQRHSATNYLQGAYWRRVCTSSAFIILVTTRLQPLSRSLVILRNMHTCTIETVWKKA